MASSGSFDPEPRGAIYRKRLVPLQPLRSRQRGPELIDARRPFAACAITKNACEAGDVYPAIGVAKELTSRERTVAFNVDSVLGYFEAEHKRPPTDAAEHHLLKILPLAAELLAQL